MIQFRHYSKVVMTLFFISFFTCIFCFPSVPNMFRMNKQLQEEGYYMAEFEYKMLGICYNLDRGHYLKGYLQLSRLNKQLKTRKGLIKLPKFNNKHEEMEFYLNLQNPNTGAFMDESFPYCTFTGPTGNILIHLESLAKETGQPVKLKYPLKYLDKINTPETLVQYLNDVATVGYIGNKFPQTSFHYSRDLLSLFYEDNTLLKYNLYEMTPEWKNTLLKWFYEQQDSVSGVWGPRNKKGKLVRKDTQNTASILKSFIDQDGNNVHKDFPFRYQDQLANTYLTDYSYELPSDNELDDWHEWNLNTSKTIRTLFRCLWSHLSIENREKTKTLMRHFILTKFQKFYVKKDGAFSYYPYSDNATLDGCGGVVSNFKEIGAFSGERFTKIWGPAEQLNLPGRQMKVSGLMTDGISELTKNHKVNSIRVYMVSPDSNQYSKNVIFVYYPEIPVVFDVMDWIPQMKNWVRNTTQSMGNWTSKEDLLNSLNSTEVEPVPIFLTDFPNNKIEQLLEVQPEITIIGFDELQLPVCRYIIIR